MPTRHVAQPPAPSQTTAFALELGDRVPFELFFRSSDAVLAAPPEAYVAAALLPAMWTGADLTVDTPIDPRFARNLTTIQDIYSTWYPEAHRIAVHAPTGTPPSPSSPLRTATFFTGGVDSFYTLLKHLDEIDVLLYVHGFDVALNDAPLRRQVSDMLRTVSNHFGKEVIELETNLRQFSDQHVSWIRYYGSALACVAHVLRNEISHVYVPAAHTYNFLSSAGAHPLLDPLWGSSGLEIVHDGCEATRIDKCRTITESEMALSTLRVCWENPGGAYNCGRCEKCQRTMVNLLAAGALDRCPVFDAELDPDVLSDVTLDQRPHRTLMKQNLRALQDQGKVPEVQQAIRTALRGPSWTERTTQTVQWAYRAVRRRTGTVLRRWYLLD